MEGPPRREVLRPTPHPGIPHGGGGGAFGLDAEPGRPYGLRLARYPAAAEVIDAFVGERRALGLDAGVGRGRLARLTAAPGLRWVGLDLSALRLRKAAESRRYRLVRGRIERMPFLPGSFDVVCCIQVLEHFTPDVARRLTGALDALLRPGGLMLLSVPIFPPGSAPLLQAANRVLARWRRGPAPEEGHLSHFDLKRALRLVPEGYALVDVQGMRLFSLPGKAFEDRVGWYRAHRWAGRRLPAWTLEVNVSARKPG